MIKYKDIIQEQVHDLYYVFGETAVIVSKSIVKKLKHICVLMEVIGKCILYLCQRDMTDIGYIIK